MNSWWTRGLTACLLCVLADMVGAAEPATGSGADGSRTWDFEVQLDGKPIGNHRFVVTTGGGRTTVNSKAQFAVKLLGITVYRYRHEDAESWRGNCLESMQSHTDDNGDIFTVNAEGGADGLKVKTRDGTTPLAGCVMGFAYWNPAMLAQKSLLNSQNGAYQAVMVGAPVADEVQARGQQQPTRRYHLTGPDNPLDIWYSASGEWLGLESTVSGGKRLRYLLRP